MHITDDWGFFSKAGKATDMSSPRLSIHRDAFYPELAVNIAPGFHSLKKNVRQKREMDKQNNKTNQRKLKHGRRHKIEQG